MKQLTQSRQGDCREPTSKLCISEGYDTRGKHSLNTEVTWSRVLWGHFNTPQQFLFQNVEMFCFVWKCQAKCFDFARKEFVWGCVFFSQNFHPEKKSWHFRSLFQCGIKTNTEMSGFAAGWKSRILPSCWCNALAPALILCFEAWVDVQRVGFWNRRLYVQRNLETYVIHSLWCLRLFQHWI